MKAAVAQSAGSNQPFVCPCALAGGRLSRCSCEVPKCTCWDSTSLPLFLFSSPRKYGTTGLSRRMLAVLGASAPSTLFSWSATDGNLRLVLEIINSELGRIWRVNKCSSVSRPARFLVHFLFLVLVDERFSSYIKGGIVSARGCVALGSSPEAGCWGLRSCEMESVGRNMPGAFQQLQPLDRRPSFGMRNLTCSSICLSISVPSLHTPQTWRCFLILYRISRCTLPPM